MAVNWAATGIQPRRVVDPIYLTIPEVDEIYGHIRTHIRNLGHGGTDQQIQDIIGTMLLFYGHVGASKRIQTNYVFYSTLGGAQQRIDMQPLINIVARYNVYQFCAFHANITYRLAVNVGCYFRAGLYCNILMPGVGFDMFIYTTAFQTDQQRRQLWYKNFIPFQSRNLSSWMYDIDENYEKVEGDTKFFLFNITTI